MLSIELIIRRLALIKYLFNLGVQQSMQAETVAGFSILTFHDCAEMFLILVAENKGDNSSNLNFIGFWDKYPELTLKESMRNLKDRRVNIKHKGLFPSKTDIEISRITMTEFLEQNTKIQFGLNFGLISISDLISYDNVREYIKKAETYSNKGLFFDCLVDTKKAFIELLSTYESSKRKEYWYESLLNIGHNVGNDYSKLVGSNDKYGARWFEEVTVTINLLRDILKITALGIDYKRYVFFDNATPKVSRGWRNGELIYIIQPKELFEDQHNLRVDNCQFCISFVIDCAIKLQDFDFDIHNILS